MSNKRVYERVYMIGVKRQTIRLLVCGGRDWTDKSYIDFLIRNLMITYNIAVVIEGGAKGVDALAKEVANKYKIPVREFPANWAKYGKAAGPIRNKQMIVEGKPDYVLAVHTHFEHSKGTKNMVGLAKKSSIPCWIVGEKNVTITTKGGER